MVLSDFLCLSWGIPRHLHYRGRSLVCFAGGSCSGKLLSYLHVDFKKQTRSPTEIVPLFSHKHTDFRPQGDVTKKHVIMCMCVTNNHLLASHIVVLEYPGAGHSSCLEGCGVKQERGTTKLRRPHPRYTQNTTVEEHGSSQGPCVPAEFETRAKASELYCVRNFSCVGWQVGTWFNLLITVWGGGQEKKKRDDEEENLCTTNRRPRPKQQ